MPKPSQQIVPQTMIRVEEADSLIRRHLPSFPAEATPLKKAHGRILRDDILADRDLPPFHRVTMDGIAIVHDAFAKGVRKFRVEAEAGAGDEPPPLSDPDTGCIQVMTGAMLPGSCDCVIPVEELTVKRGFAHLHPESSAERWQHVHRKGSDRVVGDCVLRQGITLNATHIAIAAAVGCATLKTARRPRLAVVTTGNEIVPVHRRPGPVQIRSSNDYGIRAALLRSGYPAPGLFHAPDDREQTEQVLSKVLKACEGLVLTGGVSMGKHDFVPAALASLKIRQVFHKVRQRPGKPFWFGISREGKPVFALPGNPVSTLVCLHRFVIPNLEQAGGAERPPAVYAVLEEDVVFTGKLTYHVPVKIKSRPDGRISAWPVTTNTSGDFASLQESDGFVELPRAGDVAPAGTTAAFYRWI